MENGVVRSRNWVNREQKSRSRRISAVRSLIARVASLRHDLIEAETDLRNLLVKKGA